MKMKIFGSKYHSLAAFLKRCNFTDISLADSKLLNLRELFAWLDLLYLNLKNTRAKLQELNTGTEISV